MAIETEIKVRLSNLGAFRGQLQAMDSILLSSRHFEDNFLLDFPDGRMHARASLIRIRIAGDKAWITFKGPPRLEGVFKTREELETAVGDGTLVLQILEKLGLQVSFRYQKYRQEYALSVRCNGREKVLVSLDETPVGCFAEFEGSEDAIRAAAAAMGLDESKFLRTSYYSLYLQFCSERGEFPSHMVFPVDEPATNLPI
ncbi:MAG TPA: class IV adenylate cyclase [Acidobacteriota bacterium]|nr:class IV adenylate cyclase [Acidobacteriota bacterium]